MDTKEVSMSKRIKLNLEEFIKGNKSATVLNSIDEHRQWKNICTRHTNNKQV